MKCPKCNGKGMVDYPMYADDEHKWQYCVARMKKCDMCNGTGEVSLTNDEWRRTCSTEEFAEFLFIIGEDNWLTDISNRDEIVPHEKDVVDWLKQPHREE